MRLGAGWLVVAALLAAGAARAAGVAPVEISATTTDNLGQQLVFELREELAASRTMKSVDSTSNVGRVRLGLVTQNNESSSGLTQSTTAYSLAISVVIPDQPAPYLLTHSVGVCGSQKVRDCARSILAAVSAQAATYTWP